MSRFFVPHITHSDVSMHFHTSIHSCMHVVWRNFCTDGQVPAESALLPQCHQQPGKKLGTYAFLCVCVCACKCVNTHSYGIYTCTPTQAHINDHSLRQEASISKSSRALPSSSSFAASHVLYISEYISFRKHTCAWHTRSAAPPSYICRRLAANRSHSRIAKELCGCSRGLPERIEGRPQPRQIDATYCVAQAARHALPGMCVCVYVWLRVRYCCARIMYCVGACVHTCFMPGVFVHICMRICMHTHIHSLSHTCLHVQNKKSIFS